MDILTYVLSKNYTDKQIEEAKREGFKVQVEQDRSILELTGEEKVFYFLPKNPQKTKDGYDEFIYTNNDWEQVGVTDIDLSAYALKSEIPTKVSQLQNDSGYLTQHQDISGKASIENGVIDSDNVAWYTQEEQGYIITGAYTILGNICILNATAKCVPTWERVYYSLPVASTSSSTTVALSGNNIYSIATGTLDNISVLEIKQTGTTSMDDSTIHFTLIYKCDQGGV